jgi:hypothetical protein
MVNPKGAKPTVWKHGGRGKPNQIKWLVVISDNVYYINTIAPIGVTR